MVLGFMGGEIMFFFFPKVLGMISDVFLGFGLAKSASLRT